MHREVPAVEELEYRDFSLSIHNRSIQDKQFIKAQLELTYACNLHCVHCYTDPLNRPDLLKREMPYARVIAALDKLHDEGILWLCLTGGEIFMRKDFLQIYDHAYEKGFLITLFSNGTMITDALADHLASKPPFAIEISFHGSNAKTFDTITKVPGSFEKCVKGIRMLLARKLPVKLKTKAMTLNRNELGEIKSFVEGLGLQFSVNAIIYPRLDGDASSCEYRLTPEEILSLEFDPDSSEEEEESCAVKTREDLEMIQKTPVPTNVYRCGCGKVHTHIDPYGQVGACTWSRRGRFDFSEKSIQEGMTALAHDLHSEDYAETSSCRSCAAHALCQKQPEMAQYEASGIQAPVPHFCDIAFGRLEWLKKSVNSLTPRDNQIH